MRCKLYLVRIMKVCFRGTYLETPVFRGSPYLQHRVATFLGQHFYCNMVDAIRTTPKETFFESLLLLWFLALVLAGCCGQLVWFEFGVLRCPCIPETGRLENTYREEEKKTLCRSGYVASRGPFLNANS